MNLSLLHATDDDFTRQLEEKLGSNQVYDRNMYNQINKIIHDVRTHGDDALIDYTNQFDQLNIQSTHEIKVPLEEIKQSWFLITSAQRTALKHSFKRITEYHQHQKLESWQYQKNDGIYLGQQVTSLDKVGIYVPGGKAIYPSSVLMNAIPATIAGVSEIIMTTPAKDGLIAPIVLAAAHLTGITTIFTIGGAQAIAALAYGTKTIPKVNKIVGPGNKYVAGAKKMVFGDVGIDMIAGPSEIVVISDASLDPQWVAADLMAQAEHDEEAQAILICPNSDFIASVKQSIHDLLPTMIRADIIQKSLESKGLFIKVDSLEQAVQISNTIAPEHLELAVNNPQALLPHIKNAGAIFLGSYTCESIGDYCAGPNHTLPTSGSAAFSSPLGVYDFQKRSSIIYCQEKNVKPLAKTAATLATSEGLTAHALAAKYRL